MRRKFGHVVNILFLALCAAAAILWVRTLWLSDYLNVRIITGDEEIHSPSRLDTTGSRWSLTTTCRPIREMFGTSIDYRHSRRIGPRAIVRWNTTCGVTPRSLPGAGFSTTTDSAGGPTNTATSWACLTGSLCSPWLSARLSSPYVGITTGVAVRAALASTAATTSARPPAAAPSAGPNRRLRP